MTKEKAIQIVKSMSKKDIESAAVVKHKQTSKGVKWSDNSILSQRSKHVMVSRYDAFRKYLNRNLLG